MDQPELIVNETGRAARESPLVGTKLRRGLKLTALTALLVALYRFLRERAPDTGGLTFTPDPLGPPRPVPASTGGRVEIPSPVEPEGGPEAEGELTGIAPWIEPVDGDCPASHPVKAKLASGIFHLPGSRSYERTRPDRCYLDGRTAESDGLRAAKR